MQSKKPNLKIKTAGGAAVDSVEVARTPLSARIKPNLKIKTAGVAAVDPVEYARTPLSARINGSISSLHTPGSYAREPMSARIRPSEKRSSRSRPPLSPLDTSRAGTSSPRSPSGAHTPPRSPGSVSNYSTPAGRKAAREAVAVEIRVRPLLSGESRGTMDVGSSSITINDDYQLKQYSFDSVHSADATQRSIYARSAEPVVSKVIEGFDGTILAYGQTGSGKTHTMMGELQNEVEFGIIPRSIDTIFAGADQSPPGLTTKSYSVTISFFEIYNENVYDLLGECSSRDVSKKVPLVVREDKAKGFTVVDLSHFTVRDKADFLRLIEMGSKNRAVQGTVQNSVSSRSHSFLTVDIERTLVLATSNLGGALDLGPPTRMSSRLNLVDLAGSERFKHYTADDLGTSLSKETLAINQSLSCLSNVINALTSNGKVIPYRDSKLTRLLKHSLGGNSKTLFIACVNPSDDNCKESLATLRYATRAKQIKNKPTRNTDPENALNDKLQEMAVELNALRPLKFAYGEIRKVVDELATAIDGEQDNQNEDAPNDEGAEGPRAAPTGEDVILEDAETLRRLGEVWSFTGSRHKQDLAEARREVERLKRRAEDAESHEKEALQVREVRLELDRVRRTNLKLEAASKSAQADTSAAARHRDEMERLLREQTVCQEELESSKGQNVELKRLVDESETLRLSEVAEVRSVLDAAREEQIKNYKLNRERLREVTHAKETLEASKESLLRKMAEGDEYMRGEIEHERSSRATLILERQVEKEELQALRLQLQEYQQGIAAKDQDLRELEQRLMKELKVSQVELTKAYSEIAKYQQSLLEQENTTLVQMQQVKDRAVAEGDERHKQDLAEERDLRLSERESAVKEQFLRERIILKETRAREDAQARIEEREKLILELGSQIEEARDSKKQMIRSVTKELGRMRLEHEESSKGPPPPADAEAATCQGPCKIM